METVIKRRKRDFSQIQNDWIVSKDLSDAAFRLICYIEMQADTWKFYKEEIKKRFWWWEDKYTLSMQALKKNWYISHYPVKNAQWKIDHWVIELTYETQPVGVKTTPWLNQGVDEPAHGEPPQYNNTNENNTNLSNKKGNNGPDGQAPNSSNPKKKVLEKKGTPPTPPLTKFSKPTLDQVKSYCDERSNWIDAQRFIDYYDARWRKIWKNSMKDWKAAVRTWESNNKDRSKSPKPLFGKQQPSNFHEVWWDYNIWWEKTMTIEEYNQKKLLQSNPQT